MGRKKSKTSTTYGNFGLTIEENKKLVKKTQDEDISVRQLIRKLIREWLEK